MLIACPALYFDNESRNGHFFRLVEDYSYKIGLDCVSNECNTFIDSLVPHRGCCVFLSA